MLQFVSFPHFGQSGFFAAPAQFGKQFDGRPESHVEIFDFGINKLIDFR
jgi:hypothetical protein